MWSAWNFDPFVLGALVVLGALGYAGSRTATERLCRSGACLALAIAFVSPLCALATSLFSARVLHHVLIIAVAAPLLAVGGRPDGSLFPRLFPRLPLFVPFAVHGALVWLWHAPGPYTWALSGDVSYWAMELSLLGSGYWMWREVLGARHHPAAGLATLVGTFLHMGLLGALFTFSREPLFAVHFGTTHAYGLSPLQDQQLAGLLMWVPAAGPYVIGALHKAMALLQRVSGPGNVS